MNKVWGQHFEFIFTTLCGTSREKFECFSHVSIASKVQSMNSEFQVIHCPLLFISTKMKF